MKKVITVVESKFLSSMNLRIRAPQLITDLLILQNSAEVLHGLVHLTPVYRYGLLFKYKQLRGVALGKGD